MTWTTRQRSEFGQLAAISTGSGPQLLFLHGVGLRAEAWSRQLDAFDSDYSMIAPDMPGHGKSSRFIEGPSLADYTDRIATALNAPTVVVGHSMGSMIALDLAARYPDLVLGVVPLNAIYRRTPEARKAVMARATELDGLSVPNPAGPLQRWFGNSPSPESTACDDWLRSCDPQGYRAAYGVFARGDAPSDNGLQNLQCPALFMTGQYDQNSTPAMSNAMANLTANGASAIVEGAGHMMPMTHSAILNDALVTFMENVSHGHD